VTDDVATNTSGAISICNNVFDAPYGSCVYIEAGTGQTHACAIKSVSICGNTGFSNELMPSGANSIFKIDSTADDVISGLSIASNAIRGQYAGAASGYWKWFADFSGHAGTIKGGVIANNVATDIQGSGATYLYSAASAPTGITSSNNSVVDTGGTAHTG
jgi:hypothetical protein